MKWQLGAVEFLVKPLSEEKLRNIWQHVVHKVLTPLGDRLYHCEEELLNFFLAIWQAFNTSGSAKLESVDSVKEFVGSILEIQQQNIATQTQVTEKPMRDAEVDQSDHDQSASGDKFPAPSTPQIKQSGRSLDDGDYPDQTNGSPIKEGGECDEETKSVDNTYNGESSAKMEVDPPQPTSVVVIKEEEDRSDGSRGTDISVPQSHDKEDANVSLNSGNSNKESKNVRGTKGSRRKLKVWMGQIYL